MDRNNPLSREGVTRIAPNGAPSDLTDTLSITGDILNLKVGKQGKRHVVCVIHVYKK